MPSTENEKKAGEDLQPRVKLSRSPSYPYVDLPRAISYVERLHATYKTHAIPENTAFKLMGYSEKASGARRVAATLMDFGLLESVKGLKGRDFRVTDRAKRILLKAEDAAELLKSSALMPDVFKSVWDHYNGDLPPDESIKNFLIFKLNFNDEVVHKVISLFRKSIEFAGVAAQSGRVDADAADPDEGGDGGNDSGENEDETGKISKATGTVNRQVNLSEIQEMRFPLTKGREALLYIPKDMGKRDFVLLAGYLDLAQNAAIDEDLQE
jgi:hypothetical protein